MSHAGLQFFIANDPFYSENSYTVYAAAGGACWVVDPGLPPQGRTILQHIKQQKLQVDAIILTHGHADHIAGLDEVLAGVGNVPVYMARDAWPALSDPDENLSGLTGEGFTCKFRSPTDLPHGCTLMLGDLEWKFFDVSGHGPGSRAAYCASEGVVIVGDALFAGSIGRVDFPHSNGRALIRNIHDHLLTLPDETRVLSGHGPETTIGRERRSNPFLNPPL